MTVAIDRTRELWYYECERPEMLAHVPERAGKVIEFGCGCGGFAAGIKKKSGAEVWGVEISANAAEQARQVLHRVLVGDALQQITELPDGYFDCAVFNDVLEHLAQPWDVLKALKGKLAAGGVVVASIPNIRYCGALKRIVFDADFPTDDYGIFDRTHLHFFTRQSMLRLFREAGYDVVTMEGINSGEPTKKWKRWVFRAALRMAGKRFGDMRWQQYAVVARAT